MFPEPQPSSVEFGAELLLRPRIAAAIAAHDSGHGFRSRLWWQGRVSRRHGHPQDGSAKVGQGSKGSFKRRPWPFLS